MAAIVASSVVAPVAVAQGGAPKQAKSSLARIASSKVVAPVSNGSSASSMQVWTPINNKFFETFSYLPPLSDGEIAKQVDFIVNNGFVPCLEFADQANAYTDSTNCIRFGTVSALYYDNRYWTMWKLPLFGCTDPSQVLREIRACVSAFPEAYVRLVAFDNVRQVQCAGFLVHRPPLAKEYRSPSQRSV